MDKRWCVLTNTVVITESTRLRESVFLGTHPRTGILVGNINDLIKYLIIYLKNEKTNLFLIILILIEIIQSYKNNILQNSSKMIEEIGCNNVM